MTYHLLTQSIVGAIFLLNRVLFHVTKSGVIDNVCLQGLIRFKYFWLI